MTRSVQRQGQAGSNSRAVNAAILDKAHLDRQTFGDTALQREVLLMFQAQCQTMLEHLSSEVGAKELVAMTHSLKGAAYGVGAYVVGNEAGFVEDEVESGRLVSLSALQAALQEICVLIEDLLGSAARSSGE